MPPAGSIQTGFSSGTHLRRYAKVKNFRLAEIILAFREEELKDFSEVIPARMEQLWQADRYNAEPGHC